MSGPQCCANAPTLDPNSGVGSVEVFGGLKSYLTGSAESKSAILLVSDIFGFEAPNFRKLADKLGTLGYYVVVPEFMHDDPYDPAKGELFVWLQGHGWEKGVEEAIPIVEAIKSKGFAKIGAAGMCWGAKVVVELAKKSLIQAGVLCHPSFVTVDDIKDVKAPLAVLGAEIDNFSPPEMVKQFAGALKVDGYVKIFPGVEHGWTVRYDATNAEAARNAEEAHQNMFEWFAKYAQ